MVAGAALILIALGVLAETSRHDWIARPQARLFALAMLIGALISFREDLAKDA